MLKLLSSLVDRWIGRRARIDAAAIEAVSGKMPAVVITGGSRGIGRALARCFAAEGRCVVIVARSEAPLAEAAASLAAETGARVIPLALDVTLPDATERLDAVLAGNGLYLDVLINNAGFGFAGRFHEQDAGEIGRLIALNIEAVTRLMHHALPPMIARGRGGILNVASLGGFVPGPQQAAYYASKAYVLSLTEAVAHEARGLGVRISAVAPGPVETAFHRNMGAEPALYRSVLPSLSAERAANSAYAGFMLGRRVIVPGILAPLAAAALRLLPHTLSVPIVGQLLAVHAPGARTVAGPPDAAPPD